MSKLRSIAVMAIAILFLAGSLAAQSKDSVKTVDSTKQEKPKTAVQKGKDLVVIETNMGTIELKLFRAQAPKTVENFEGLAKKGYYNGLTFHRVIEKFMLQGGDPTGTGAGGESIYGKDFEDEISPDLKFDRPGLLAMANRGPGTNGSQFFITLVPTTWLNGHHTIFGEVVGGMDVVEAIGKVKTSKPGDKPLTPVVMKKVYLKEGSEKAPKESKPKK
ncbi:MAG TPA: peptidylprolyl isomerase [Bacteroidota bacterium]|jgi:peptidylprolyl isomerase